MIFVDSMYNMGIKTDFTPYPITISQEFDTVQFQFINGRFYRYTINDDRILRLYNSDTKEYIDKRLKDIDYSKIYSARYREGGDITVDTISEYFRYIIDSCDADVEFITSYIKTAFVYGNYAFGKNYITLKDYYIGGDFVEMLGDLYDGDETIDDMHYVYMKIPLKITPKELAGKLTKFKLLHNNEFQ
jgi:hypothetical protein